MDTVTLTIDGRPVTVAKGRSVLQAAIEAGTKVPYYCYHPALGVDGSCRVCLVKIEKMPKLQVSCSVTATEGMVVSTATQEVEEARAGVFEFLLLNHPLDCPVCDKGGECPLQDFSYAFGRDDSRMEFPRRTFDGEGVKADVDFGPTLMLNRNRCILCTRCVRFMQDIDGDAQIGIMNRGNGSEIATFEEQGVHSLLSGNLMDVCPVGAITTRDYRFKSRPWDNPSAVDTICTLCEKGCSTTMWLRAKPEWAKGAQLVRVTPRLNEAVNGYWMCDIGRFDYHWVEGDARLTQPMVRGAGGLAPVPWDSAITAAATALKAGAAGAPGPRFLLSAHGSTEELYVAARIAQHVLGEAAPQAVDVTWTTSSKAQPSGVKFVVPTVDAPNVGGARLLGLTGAAAGEAAPSLDALRADVAAGKVSALFVLDPGPAGSLGDVAWIAEARTTGTLKTLVVQGVVGSALSEAADVVLSGACWVEKEACYTNGQGILQTTSKVIPPPGYALEDTVVLLKLAAKLGAGLTMKTTVDVRADLAGMAGQVPGLAGIDTVSFNEVKTAAHWLQSSNPMERGKWDVLFNDLPPVKFADTLQRRPAGKVIPLVETK
ncbi:MAG: 2Fe-2S iron-sulfur cluster-binding protein [Vicinamibacteraceae bacterium]